MVRSPGYQGWCFFRALSSAGWMWWMQVGMDTLQKLQLLGNKRQKGGKKDRCLFIPMQRLGMKHPFINMAGYQVPGIWYMYERHEYHEYLDKCRSHIENYEDLQRKIHGEMITNSLDSWIHEFLKKHLRKQWVPGLINKNAEATGTLWKIVKHQIPTIVFFKKNSWIT